MGFGVPSLWEMLSILEAVRGRRGPVDCLTGSGQGLRQEG